MTVLVSVIACPLLCLCLSVSSPFVSLYPVSVSSPFHLPSAVSNTVRYVSRLFPAEHDDVTVLFCKYWQGLPPSPYVQAPPPYSSQLLCPNYTLGTVIGRSLFLRSSRHDSAHAPTPACTTRNSRLFCSIEVLQRMSRHYFEYVQRMQLKSCM